MRKKNIRITKRLIDQAFKNRKKSPKLLPTDNISSNESPKIPPVLSVA